MCVLQCDLRQQGACIHTHSSLVQNVQLGLCVQHVICMIYTQTCRLLLLAAVCLYAYFVVRSSPCLYSLCSFRLQPYVPWGIVLAVLDSECHAITLRVANCAFVRFVSVFPRVCVLPAPSLCKVTFSVLPICEAAARSVSMKARRLITSHRHAKAEPTTVFKTEQAALKHGPKLPVARADKLD